MTEQGYLAQMPLKIGGSDAPRNMMRALREIVVDTSLHLPDMFTINLDDENLIWMDSTIVRIGAIVEISGVPGGREGGGTSTQLITKGEITAIEPEMSGDGGTNLIIRGYDKSHRLYRGKKTRVFKQMSDTDIIKKIAGECGLQPEVDSTDYVYEHVFQDYQTDIEFIRERAQRDGCYVYVKDGKLFYRRQPSVAGQAPDLEWGENLVEFHARFTAAEQVAEAKVHGWDPKNKQAIIGKVAKPKGTPTVDNETHGGEMAKKAFNIKSEEVVNNRPVWNQGEAEKFAQSILNEKSHAFFYGEGRCFGNPNVRAGVEVNLKGISKRFSGRYRITRAVHRYDMEGYYTDFEISGFRDNTLEQLLSSKDKSGYGVVVGIVTNVKDDQGLARVKVKYPTISDQLESNWARLVTPMAGAGRGIEFIPEVNDEVLVAFEYDDINKPYILGALWNGKDKPPESSDQIVGDDGKVQKRIIHSRSGHTITLDDSSGKEKISIIDKTKKNLLEIDSTKNSMSVQTSKGHRILMDDTGITIESAGTMTLKSKGNLLFQSQANMTTKSTGNMEIQSTGNMTTKSTGMMNIKGNMTSIDGGPMTEIKGGMVKIN